MEKLSKWSKRQSLCLRVVEGEDPQWCTPVVEAHQEAPVDREEARWGDHPQEVSGGKSPQFRRCARFFFFFLNVFFFLLLDYYDSGNGDSFFKGMSSRGPPPMKRGPPVRNGGGPPPKRSAMSGPMGRRTCAINQKSFVKYSCLITSRFCMYCSPHVKGQGFVWPTTSSQRLHDVQKRRLPITKRWPLQLKGQVFDVNGK